MLRRLYSIAFFAAVSSSLYAYQVSGAPAQQPLLPADFAGWHQTASAQLNTDPQAADQTNAPVLREYGFTQSAAATYMQAGNKLNIRAMRFEDATGAYGAFTFYRNAGMRKADIGSEGALDGGHALFWTGVTLVDAVFDHIPAASATQLRDLAKAVPNVGGTRAIAPSLPQYLPEKSLEAASVRYALGTESYARGGGVLPPGVVGFDRDAEAITARYSSSSASGALTLVMYPTPQIAAGHQKAIEDLLKGGVLPQVLAQSSPASRIVRRNGPIVAFTSGNFSANEANKLLDAVQYNAKITWNHPEGYVSEETKTARFLLGVATLTGVLGGAAIILGLFFGGGRALIRRMRGKPPSSLSDEQFISLKLR